MKSHFLGPVDVLCINILLYLFFFIFFMIYCNIMLTKVQIYSVNSILQKKTEIKAWESMSLSDFTSYKTGTYRSYISYGLGSNFTQADLSVNKFVISLAEGRWFSMDTQVSSTFQNKLPWYRWKNFNWSVNTIIPLFRN